MKTKEFFQQVSLNEIQPNEANVRECFDNASIQELADSIQNSGLINPLTLRAVGKNQYAIICGERRFRAAQLLGWKSINAYIKDVTAEEAQELCLIENIQREDISPIEEAKAYEKLLQTSGDINELISRTGKSEKYIRVRLKLNHLIADFAELLQTGEIGIGVAAVICEYSEEIQKDVHSRFFDKTSYSNWFNLPQEAVKKRIESNYTSCLKDYKFNKQECASCPHNTANFSLFCEDSGKCVNPTCLQEKNASYLTAEAIRIKQENPLAVLCKPVYSQTNDTVIERLLLQEYEIKDNANCRYYPNEPKQPDFSNIETEEEKEHLAQLYQNKMQEYNESIKLLEQKEEEGSLTRFVVIQDKNIVFQYQEHEAESKENELQKELKSLQDKDKRNTELKTINTIKDTKAFIEANDIPHSEFSESEEKYLYFFLLDALDRKHHQDLGVTKDTYYVSENEKKEIVERGLSEELKTIIKRDFLVKGFRTAFGKGVTSDYFIAFAKEHFHDDVEKIEQKYTEVYNKRFKKIKEQIASIKKQLKQGKKKMQEASKKAA